MRQIYSDGNASASRPPCSKHWRQALLKTAALSPNWLAGKEQDGAKFRIIVDYSEALSKGPSHRAWRSRGRRNEGMLSIALELVTASRPAGAAAPCEA